MSASASTTSTSSPLPPNTTPIAHRHASSLTPDEFLHEYVEKNQPVIIEGALGQCKKMRVTNETTMEATFVSSSSTTAADSSDEWWRISDLSHLIGDMPMQNVFVASAAHRNRFKYFKAAAPSFAATTSSSSTSEAATAAESAGATVASSASNQVDTGLQRSKMTFHQFVECSMNSKRSEAEQEQQDAYYLYGEPMPAPLVPFFPIPSILSSVTDPITSTLLWVSPAPTVSPLHYDLSEGILAQVHGAKRITLLSPQYYNELYPHPVAHQHDRQSRIDDIHAPNSKEFPLALSLPRQTGLLTAGCFLYIPYGWWHQIESTGTSISVSQRWNPHVEALKQLATSWHVTAKMPAMIREQICRAQLDAVPQVVATVNRRRWDEIKT